MKSFYHIGIVMKYSLFQIWFGIYLLQYVTEMKADS